MNCAPAPDVPSHPPKLPEAEVVRAALVGVLVVTAIVWLSMFMHAQVYGDGVETSIARMVEALARGETLYEPFGSHGRWVNDTYPAFYLWLSVAARSVVRDSVLATRVVSLFAGAVLAVIVLCRTRGAPRAVVLSVASLLLAFPFLRWLVAARSDLLAVAFLAGALRVLWPPTPEDSERPWRAWVAGCLVGCALATKQSLMGVVLGVALAFLWRRRGDYLRIGLAAAATLGAWLLLYRALYPDVVFHLFFGGQAKFTLEFGLKVTAFALPCAVPFALAFLRTPPAVAERSRPELLPALLLGTLAWAVFASFKRGSDSNYYLELYLVLVLGCAIRRVEVPRWGVLLVLVFTAINVGSELSTVPKRERSRAAVLAILERFTGGDRNYFATQHASPTQPMLINIPLDVSLQFPPARMDYYMAGFEEQGRLSLVPLREQFCAAHPRLVISRYAIDGTADYRRDYLRGSLPAMVSCTTFTYRCASHFLYSDTPLPIEAGDGCQLLSQ